MQNIELLFQKLEPDSMARTPFWGGGILNASVFVCVSREREREYKMYTALTKQSNLLRWSGYARLVNMCLLFSHRLHRIPQRFANIPALALHCSLFELVPLNGKWSQEAVKTFATMMNG